MVEEPKRIAQLPKDRRGYRIPFFVAWVDNECSLVEPGDGIPDFRIMDPYKALRCVRERLCWICGQRLGANLSFVIGPMCAVNRISSEPPQHRDCALYSVRTCPWLTHPVAPRRETALPEGVTSPAGVSIRRNPGVSLVWMTRSFEVIRTRGGRLFRVGDAEEVLWFAEGRSASRAEVMASIESGLPTLMEMAKKEGQRAVLALERMVGVAMQLVPMES